jgi:hypothetical protein
MIGQIARGVLIGLSAGLGTLSSESALAQTNSATPVPPVSSSPVSEDIGLAILQMLVEEGLVSSDKAKGLLQRARAAADLRRQREAPATASTIEVPYVPEVVKEQIRDELRRDVIAEATAKGWVAPNAVPAWINGIKLSGDFRLRYELIKFGADNFPSAPDADAINRLGGVTTAAGFPLLNTTIDRNRLRYRARVGLDARIIDQVAFGVRLGSGQDRGPISTNTGLGSYSQGNTIYVDRAFVRVTPVAGFDVMGGRIANPFYASDLVWDPDLNLEGVAASISHDFGAVRGFANGGAFPLEERGDLSKGRLLYAGQIGIEAQSVANLKAKLAVAYYNFTNVQSKLNLPGGSRLTDNTVPTLLSTGNSLFNVRTDGTTTLAGLASKFELINVTGGLSYTGFDPIMVHLNGDYVRNIAFDAREIDRLRGEPGVPAGNIGWQVGLTVGHDKLDRFGTWQLHAAYKSLETDAVLDIFTDSDFGTGGTDAKGFVIKAGIGIYRNTALGVSFFSTNAINRPPLAIDVLQLDLRTEF